MIRKSTLVVVILFLLLLAVALYLSKNPLPSTNAVTPTPMEQANLLPGINAQDITSLTMKPAEGDAVAVEQDAQGNWIVDKSTGQVSSSPGKIEQARDELASALVTATLPADYSLAAVGLENPRSAFTLGTSSGEQYILNIGSETPTPGGIYVQVNDSVPVVVNGAVIETVTSLLTEASAPQTEKATPEVTQVP